MAPDYLFLLTFSFLLVKTDFWHSFGTVHTLQFATATCPAE